MKAPVHPRERERLAALERYRILDSGPDARFDAITQLAAAICGTPISFVSLLDDRRQWFKSAVGLGVRETHIDSAFCAHAIFEDELMVVPDTQLDPRFVDNPLVTGDPNVRFYAGGVLRTSHDLPIGTLCVLDTVPRTLDPHQLSALSVLAGHAMNLMELERAQRDLETSLSTQRRVLATVAHDLRTPLQVIELGAQLLQRGPHPPDRVVDLAQRLEKAATCMADLTSDLLAVSRHEAQTVAEGVPLRLGSLTHDVVDLVRPLAAQGEIELTHTADSDCLVMGDPSRLRQVVVNLVANAIKFTPPAGQVAVSCRVEGTDVEVRVSDTGPGLAPDDRERIFQPFVQTLPDDARGSGLGLAIARRVVEACGGQIGVEPGQDGGSVFWFRVPRFDEASCDPSVVQRTSTRTSGP